MASAEPPESRPSLAEAPAPPPRAFAQGTGVVLQTVGVLMFVSSCCVCALGGLWDPNLLPADVAELLRRDPAALDRRALGGEPAKAGLALMIFTTTVGGLALASFGLGLQAERRRSAWGAVFALLVLLAVLAVAGAVGIYAPRTSR